MKETSNVNRWDVIIQNIANVMENFGKNIVTQLELLQCLVRYILHYNIIKK